MTQNFLYDLLDWYILCLRDHFLCVLILYRFLNLNSTLQLFLLHFTFDLDIGHFEVCLREVHSVGGPGDVVREVGGVDRGKGLGIHQQEVGLLLWAIETYR